MTSELFQRHPRPWHVQEDRGFVMVRDAHGDVVDDTLRTEFAEVAVAAVNSYDPAAPAAGSLTHADVRTTVSSMLSSALEELAGSILEIAAEVSDGGGDDE